MQADDTTTLAREFVSNVVLIDRLYVSGSHLCNSERKKFFEKYQSLYGLKMTMKFLFALYFNKVEFGKPAVKPVFFMREARKHWSITEKILLEYDPPFETIYSFLPEFRVAPFLEKLWGNNDQALISDVYYFLPEKYRIYRCLNKDFHSKKIKPPTSTPK